MAQVSEKIIEKIRHLLNKTVANGATEDEAKTAMLMAQKLMAKHGLTMSEVTAVDNKVIHNMTDSIRREWWVDSLSRIISDNFRCRVYAMPGLKKTYHYVFLGFKEDSEIAKEVFKFAAQYIQYAAKKFLKEFKKRKEQEAGYNFKKMTLEEIEELAWKKYINYHEFRKLYPNEKIYKMRLIMEIKKAVGLNFSAASIKNDFISGFLAGLKSSFEQQLKENQEMALVLVRPKEVDDEWNKLTMRKAKASKVKREFNQEAIQEGYRQGIEWKAPKGQIEGGE